MTEAKNICVVVLGDIGRSPRMQYHSLSLAEHGCKVDIVCYRETKPLDNLTVKTQVNFHYLPPYPDLILPRILNYIFKTLWQIVTLMFVLFIIRKPKILLVQNPPAVPSIFVCWLFCSILKIQYVIDWHNYAFSIMALNIGKNHVLVKITKAIEVFIGKRAAHNFCVTKEMQKDLKNTWNINATTLYDRPPEIFQPISTTQKHDLLKRLSKNYQIFKGENDECTVLTDIKNGNIVLKANRPVIVVSSTSWTEDEDFSILLKSLQEYEEHINNGNEQKLPHLICIISGKGPLKELYCQKMKERKWDYITFVTPWLDPEDYPLLLAAADLGVCLHTSSSGLDLPMKVVDMFGCGVPVCAHNFRCLNELVKHNENGFVFNNSEELSKQLQSWFENFPNNPDQAKLKEKFKKNLQDYQDLRWKENWELVAYSIFR